MISLDDADKLWFTSEPIDGVFFGLNDTVRITSGEYKDRDASVISLVSLEPVTYLVELADDGSDVHIVQSKLGGGESGSSPN